MINGAGYGRIFFGSGGSGGLQPPSASAERELSHECVSTSFRERERAARIFRSFAERGRGEAEDRAEIFLGYKGAEPS